MVVSLPNKVDDSELAAADVEETYCNSTSMA
jgi:hypothetical protein